MDTEELEDLLRELVQGVTLVMQSGEVLSDEFQGILAQTLNNLVDRIDESRNQQQNERPLPDNEPNINQLSSTPSNDAQLLWILAGQQEDAFLEYLKTYPTSGTRQLLSNPDQLNAAISQLQQMMPQGQQPTIHGIQHADLNSSNVWGANYDPKSGKMRVRFQGGSEYEYDGVPENIFRAFIRGNASAKTSGQNEYGRWWKNKSPSLGAALNQYIKAGGFNYRKLR